MLQAFLNLRNTRKTELRWRETFRVLGTFGGSATGPFALLFCCFVLQGATPEEKAIQFLAKEVPQWRDANGCFSCHNNGDGARALFVAQRKGYVVGEPALATTKAWLRKPGEWENNHGDAGVNNLRLARIQFAAALREAPSVASLIEAARSLLPYQAADGSWPVEAETNLGRPQPMAWLWLLTWLGKL